MCLAYFSLNLVSFSIKSSEQMYFGMHFLSYFILFVTFRGTFPSNIFSVDSSIPYGDLFNSFIDIEIRDWLFQYLSGPQQFLAAIYSVSTRPLNQRSSVYNVDQFSRIVFKSIDFEYVKTFQYQHFPEAQHQLLLITVIVNIFFSHFTIFRNFDE